MKESLRPDPEQEKKKKQYVARWIVVAVVILYLFDVVGLLLALPVVIIVLIAVAGKKKGNAGPEAGGGWAALRDQEQIRRSVQEACAVMRQRIGQLRGEESAGPARRRDIVETHDHIPSTALSTQKQLEQLKTLKEAGLYTPQEYEAKRRQILAGK